MDWIVVLYGISITVGIILIFIDLKFSSHDWLGYPFTILLVQATRDLGVEPLFKYFTGFEYSEVYFYERVSGVDAFKGWFVIFTGYICVAAGLAIGKRVWSRALSSQRFSTQEHITYPGQYYDTGWAVSLLFFVLGLFANGVVFTVLLGNYSLFGLSSYRAVYSAELATPIVGYMRIISPAMQFGALGMILFSSGKTGRLRMGLLATISNIVVEIFYGGRAKVIYAVFCLIVAYIYIDEKVRWKYILRYVVLGLGGLSMIGFLRYGVEEIWHAPLSAVNFLLASESARLDEAAWLVSVFPDRIPFTGWINAIGAAARFIPYLQIPGSKTLWGYVIDYYFSGENPWSGTVGGNYPSFAEFYTWGGYPSIIVFGFLAGVLFSLVFEWQRRDRKNIYLSLFHIIVLMYFFKGLQTRMPEILGTIGLAFVFITLMAAVAVRDKYSKTILLILYFDGVLFFMWWFWRGDIIKALILGSIPAFYLLGIQLMKRLNPGYLSARQSYNIQSRV